MRHGKKFNHLSRKSAHRKALLANMACSLIEHKRIKTTLAKAKALRVYVEPLITKSKDDTTHSRRTVFSYLKQKEAITELFGDIATKVADRPGGYTRILKLSNRLGDNAQMAFIELVDYNEDYNSDKPKRKKARRTKKKAIENVALAVEEAVVIEETTATEDAVEAKVEEVVEETPATQAVVEDIVEEVVEETPATEDVAEAKVEEVVEETPAIEETAEVKEETKDEADNSENKEEKGE
jgi:large subunit ribosomal protein L17